MSVSKPIPYPPNTRARGWRFELDPEQVQQSDTWALALPEARPWLLMLWMVAWQQVPCGSMPADDDVIAAKLGMPAKLFAKHKRVLLRGWWLAEDGRLYHDTITERVSDMLKRKEGERKRKADYRAKMEAQRKAEASPQCPEMSRGTDAGQTRERPGKDDTGTGTGTGTGLIPTTTTREPLEDCEVFPMSLGWRPGPQFDVKAKLAGLPVKSPDFPGPGLGEFVSYWMTQEVTMRSQSEWEHALLKSLQRDRLRPTPRLTVFNTPPAAHAGFGDKDYTKGVNLDGSLA